MGQLIPGTTGNIGSPVSCASSDVLVTLWREVREGQVATVTDHVERVTGRPPLPLVRWAEESASGFC